MAASQGVPADWMTGPTLVARRAARGRETRRRRDAGSSKRTRPVGGDIRPPERLTYVPPVYPDIARIAHVEGKVVLEATIDEWGVVKNVVVRQSMPLLDKAAIDAVSKWRYAPTRLNGQPIAIVMMVTVTFTLQN